MRSPTAVRRFVALAVLSFATATPASAQNGGRQIGSEAQVFLNAFQVIRDYGLDAMGDSAVWSKAIDGLIRELGDPYASVFTPAEFDEFQEDNTGNYAGIGVQITQLNERITITAVFRSTPAERMGLQVGDVILTVNEEPTVGWTTGRTSDVIRGEVGTSVDITVGRPGLTAPLPVTLTRDNVHVTSVVSARVADEIGYIQLDRVARSSAAEVDSALVDMDDSRGYIIDLRGNPGGLMDESIMISDLFLPPGRVVAQAAGRTPGQAEMAIQQVFESETAPTAGSKPVIVLVDEFSASAAEIVAGALQDHDRALILGNRTFGKGVFQNVFRLTDTRHLRLTTGEWYTPLGRSLHRPRGIDGRPASEDPDTFAVVTTAAGRDLQDGGGIFPDLSVRNDTLTFKEREFLSQAARAEVPIGLRIEEFAFEQADARRRSGDDPYLEADEFEDFLAALDEEGVETELIEHGEVRSYLEWQVNRRIAVRMDRYDVMLEWRRKRDPVLEEAIQLLLNAPTQTELFATATERKAALAARSAAMSEGSGLFE